MKSMKFAALALMAGTALAGAPALASSHREAPGITELRKVDGTDFYMFRSYEPGREGFVTFIANYQPDQGPGNGPNYYTLDPDAIYEIHVDADGDAVEDRTFQFKISNTLRGGTGITVNAGGMTLPIALRQGGQITAGNDANLGEIEEYSLTYITGPRRGGTRASATGAAGATFRKPVDYIGTKTLPAYAAYANQFINNVNIPGCGAGKVFVGQRAEAFAVNLGGTFDLVNYVPLDGTAFPGGIMQNRTNDDLVGKKNVTSFALEVPISCLVGSGNGVIGAWTTASLPQAQVRRTMPTYLQPSLQGGSFAQVSRLGMPLVNELVIGLPSKDLFNAVKPTADSALAQFVTNPTFPELLNTLFRAPVNATLGTNFSTIAPNNFPRNDLVATFLTGIRTLNQQSKITASEMLRLNTAVAPTPQARQSNLGVAGDDLAGFPNGRRPGDDVVDIVLRVAMGRLCHPVPINGVQTQLGLCTPANAPVGTAPFTDGAPLSSADVQNVFPYLNTPIPGSPGHDARIPN